MRFIAKSTSWRSLELTDERESVIAGMKYLGWGIRSAEITLADGRYISLKNESVMSVNITAREGDTLLCRLTMGMLRRPAIEYNGNTYSMKRTSFWSAEYTMYSPEDQPVVVFRYAFSLFGNPRYTYTIDANDNYPEVMNPVLLLMAIHCMAVLRSYAAAM